MKNKTFVDDIFDRAAARNRAQSMGEPTPEAAPGDAAGPYIDAHRSGNAIWIDMMLIPKKQRGRGVGRAYYEQWEAALPKDIELVRLMAADTGEGVSNGFWEVMGFDYQYDGDDLDYETSQYMWKGVNGHPTPQMVDAGDNE